MVKTMSKPKKYTIEFLNSLLLNYKAELIGEYSDDTIKRETRIHFKCSCGELGEKSFRQIEETGSYCKKCINLNERQKFKNTNIAKYGCENPTQNSQVKQKIRNTNIERYGDAIVLRNSIVKEKQKQTIISRYGCENPSQNIYVQQKRKNTFLERFNCEHPSQHESVKQKKKQTNMSRYNCEYTLQDKNIRNNITKTNITKYGSICSLQNIDVREKSKQTCKEKYGVEIPMHNSEVAEKASKNSYKSKTYILPSGNKIKVQGYEPWAIDELLKTYSEADLIIGDKTKVPEIWWIDSQGKRHRYYVDIYIPRENRLVEVKSSWTYKDTHVRDKIINIPLQCLTQGYKYEYWIYDTKGNKTIISEFANNQPELIAELNDDPDEKIVNQI